MAIIKAPVATFNGSVGGVQFANGEATTTNEAVIAYCEAAGYTIEYGTATEDKDATVSLPSGNASKEDWIAYALQHGTTPDELEGKTRDEIRDLITTK